MRTLLLGIFLGTLFACTLNASSPGYVVYWGCAPDVAPLSSTGVLEVAGQVVTNATALAAGNGFALALRSDSTVVGWGWNNHGQATGVPSGDRASGIVTLGGQTLSNVLMVSAEWLPVLALKGDGSLIAWGGELATVPVDDVISICARYRLAVKGDGTVVDVMNNQGVSGLSNIVAIAAPPNGNGFIVALNSEGAVISGKVRGTGVFEPVRGIGHATALASSDHQGFALRRDGTIAAWQNADGIPDDLRSVVAIAAGTHHGLALRQDGTVSGWGTFGIQPASVPEGLSNVVAIAAGPDYCLAITTNKAVAERFMKNLK